jgi:hypothetical protein
MRIEFEVSNSELNQSDLNVILQSLNVTDKSKVPEILSKIAKCAVLEYRKMFIERGLPTKAAEVMQERLFYLIKGYFKDHLPKEQEISSIFQLTPSGAKTLLKNTISRYRIYLKDEIDCSIKTVLQSAIPDQGKEILIIQSSSLKDEINNHLTQKHPELKKVVPVTDSSGQFSCPDDTFRNLKDDYGVT